MSVQPFRIATRASALARWQAEHVASLLRRVDPTREVTLVPVTTHADRHLERSIAELGGKGVFAKEVQHAVLDGRADAAVHSAKDLTARTVDGLTLAAVPTRGDARDALAGHPLADLPDGAVVGTGSARRRAQLLAMRPDLEIVGLRGNIEKRLEQLDHLDAVVLAAVALERLGLDDRVAQIFEVDTFIPQVGQGALAVECRADDDATHATLAAIQDPTSRLRVDAERAFLARLGGDCNLPAGAHASLEATGELRIIGMLSPDHDSAPVTRVVHGDASTTPAIAAGTALADALVAATGTAPPS